MSSSKNKKSIKDKYNIDQIEEYKEITYDEFQRDILLEKIKTKDQQIYDLLSKIKSQESTIDYINKEIEEKDLNMFTLEQNYKIQIEELKNILGFKGDIDNLLNKKETSYEYEFAMAMKDTQKDNIRKDSIIEKLNEEIKQIERENEQLDIFIEIKRNNETMMEILEFIKNSKKSKEENIQSKNDENAMIKALIKKNEYLRKKMGELKTNVQKSGDVLNTVPSSFLPDSQDEIKTYKEIDIKEMEKNLEKLKEKENNEKNILLNKYLSIEEQNKKDIIKGNEYMNNIDNIYSKEIKKYQEELIQIYKLIQKIIKLYYKVFAENYSVYLKKEDYDKLLHKELDNLNKLNFPLLFKFKELQDQKNNYENNNKYKKSKKIIKNELKLLLQNINSNKPIKYIVNNFNYDDNNIDYSLDEILENKSNLFSSLERKTDEQLINLSKEKLSSYVLSFNDFISDYDKFINKYIGIKNKKNYKKFLEIPKNNIKILRKKLFDINNQIKELNQKQNQINVVYEVSSNMIQKIKKENLELNKRIKDTINKEEKINIPKIEMNIIHKSSEKFLKTLSNRNSTKNYNNNKSRNFTLLTDRRYFKDNNKIYKIKIK